MDRLETCYVTVALDLINNILILLTIENISCFLYKSINSYTLTVNYG